MDPLESDTRGGEQQLIFIVAEWDGIINKYLPNKNILLGCVSVSMAGHTYSGPGANFHYCGLCYNSVIVFVREFLQVSVVEIQSETLVTI